MLLEASLPPIVARQSMQASMPGRDLGLVVLPHDLAAYFIRVQDSGANSCTTVATGPTVVLANLPPPREDFQTPLIFRSEDEQLVGYELIKALLISKLSLLSPLSPISHRESLLNNEVLVAHPKGKQSCDRRRKPKIKSSKPSFKLVRDILTKKWIIIKKDQQLRDFDEWDFTCGGVRDVFLAFVILLQLILSLFVILVCGVVLNLGLTAVSS
jgi:hypothetical protein